MEMDSPTSTTAGESLGSDFFYGWDLLFKTVEDQIGKKADVLMVLAHFMLTKHCKFRCVGIGDDKSLMDKDVGSELLPDHWNGDSAKYSLRYVHNNVLFLLMAHVVDDALIVNLLDVNTKNVSNLCITPDTLVADLKGDIAVTIPAVTGIVERIRRELCNPILTAHLIGAAQPSLQQQQQQQPEQITQSPAQGTDPLRVETPSRPPPLSPFNPPMPLGYPDVGRGDLDPLANGMGNLYPFPPNPTPVRPNVPGQSGPNPDHAQPPDWNPDQYM